MDVAAFHELLARCSKELFERDPGAMTRPDLVATPNVIDATDVALFGRALDAGLLTLLPGGRFDTQDRPTGQGRWGLLSRSAEGGWYNAEYLPEIAAYARAVLDLGYPSERVLFELPAKALQLDLAVLDDQGGVVVLGEAKRDVKMLKPLRLSALGRFAEEAPDDASKKSGDEARQLAWRLWSVRPQHLWLIGPGEVRSYSCRFDPLELILDDEIPTAASLGLDSPPPERLSPPDLAAGQ